VLLKNLTTCRRCWKISGWQFSDSETQTKLQNKLQNNCSSCSQCIVGNL